MNTETDTERRIELGKLVLSRAGLVIEFTRVVILDWDLATPNPETGVIPFNGTITHRGEVYERLAAEQTLWAVYTTRNGVRAILLSDSFGVHDAKANGLIERLNPDPWYIMHSRLRSVWTARVSCKPGREGEDRIEFVGLLGKGDMLPALYKAGLLHHQLLLMNGMTATRLPLHVLRLLNIQQYREADLSHLLSEVERQPILNPPPRSGSSGSIYMDTPFIPDPEDPLFHGQGNGAWDGDLATVGAGIGAQNGASSPDTDFMEIPF